MYTANAKPTLDLIGVLTGDRRSVMDWRTLPETTAARKRFGATRVRLKFRGTFAALEATLRQRNAAGYAVYYTLNETDGAGTKRENIKAVRALPLDLDGTALPDEWAGWMAPHVIIETSPGKYQCLWMIPPTNRLGAAQAMAARLALHYNGDPSVTDAPRILRPPGFLHQKGKPFRSRLVEIDTHPTPYALKDFDRYLPALPPREVSSTGVGAGGEISAEQLDAMLQSMPVEEFRDQDRWFKLLQSCHHATSGAGDVEFIAWSIGDPKWSDQEHVIQGRWNSCDVKKEGEAVRYGTLCMFVRKHGDPMTIPARDVGRDFENARDA